MPDLLLELFSEEIPARMQRKAAADLQKLVTDALVERGLFYEGAKAFATPRRLALTVHGLPARSPNQREETKGPPVAANEQAIAGFLRKTGLASISDAKVQNDKKKGDFYVAIVEKPGRDAVEVIAEILPPIIRSFPWPKSMRWGKRSGEPGSLTWVRPLHSIVCLFGPETSETEVVPFEIDGIRSGNVTYGHRFLAPGPITVRRFDDYMPKLEAARVVLDADRRKQMILADARDRALAVGLELVEDEGLLEEVAGLVEWPVVLMGSFDDAFLEIPPEAIRATIRANQKCFVLQEPRSAAGATGKQELAGKLANRFVLVANTEATDGGTAIVAGNQRVIRARLSDARHFWETDLKPLPDYRDKAAKPLDQRLEKLKALNIVFHEKLGTQGQRVERTAVLAKVIGEAIASQRQTEILDQYAGSVARYHNNVQRAANLAKADLVTEMVGEFPELQGLMGKYYALAQDEDASVATAIEDHYKPVGPNDRVPTEPVAIAVALADKLDTLVGFWAIDEKPTGSKDPYALRRAALGVIRIVLENGLRLRVGVLIRPLFQMLISSWIDRYLVYQFYDQADPAEQFETVAPEWVSILDGRWARAEWPVKLFLAQSPMPGMLAAFGVDDFQSAPRRLADPATVAAELQVFFADRLKVQLREQGARHDLVDAVFALGNQDDLLLIVQRVEALGKFLDTDDGKSLLAGAKRAANILRDEEKKSGETYSGAVDGALLSEPAEKALAAALDDALPAATASVGTEDFAAAMTALATLRAPVDAFFTEVRVNADEPSVRVNRLRLLNRIREATLAVADFSKIAG